MASRRRAGKAKEHQGWFRLACRPEGAGESSTSRHFLCARLGAVSRTTAVSKTDTSPALGHSEPGGGGERSSGYKRGTGFKGSRFRLEGLETYADT